MSGARIYGGRHPVDVLTRALHRRAAGRTYLERVRADNAVRAIVADFDTALSKEQARDSFAMAERLAERRCWR